MGMLTRKSLQWRESHSNSTPPEDRGDMNASRTRWCEHEAKLQRSSAQTSRDIWDIRTEPSPFQPSFRPARCTNLSAAAGTDRRSEVKSDVTTGSTMRFRSSPHQAVVVAKKCRGSVSDMESFYESSRVMYDLIEAIKDFIFGWLTSLLDMEINVQVCSPDLFVHKPGFNGEISNYAGTVQKRDASRPRLQYASHRPQETQRMLWLRCN